MKASIATAILAFCANSAIAAPVASEALSMRFDCEGKAFLHVHPPTQAELEYRGSDFGSGIADRTQNPDELLCSYFIFHPSEHSFDDPDMIGKRQLEFLPEGVKAPLRNFIGNVDPNDDNPLNPFDDPGMIGKRDAEAEPIFNKIGDLIEGIDRNDNSALNPLDGLIG